MKASKFNPKIMDSMMKMMNPTLMMNMMTAMMRMGNAGVTAEIVLINQRQQMSNLL